MCEIPSSESGFNMLVSHQLTERSNEPKRKKKESRQTRMLKMYLGWKTVSVCAKFTGSLDLANSGIPFYPTPPTHGFSLLLGMLNGDNGECNTRCLIQPKSSLSPAFCSAASHPSELRAHVKGTMDVLICIFI